MARLHEKHRQKKMTHTPFIIDMTMRFWRTASDVPFFSSVISALYSVYSSVPPLERIRSCYTAHWAFRPSVMVSANLDKVSIVLLWWTFRVAQLMCDVEGQLCALNVLIPQCLWLQLGSQALEKSCPSDFRICISLDTTWGCFSPASSSSFSLVSLSFSV